MKISERFKISDKTKGAFFKALIVFAVSALSYVITSGSFFLFNPVRQLELKYLDEMFSARGELAFRDSAKVVIVEITQDSYEGIPSPYNTWPWPKSYFAHLINNLTKAGVRAIGIDIVMSNPDQFSAENDSMLAQAIRKNRNVVLAGKVEIASESGGRTIEDINDNVDVEITETSFNVKKLDENYGCLFYGVDSSVGIVQVSSDNDGVFRRYLPFAKSPSQDKIIPTFGYAVLNKYYGLNSQNTALLTDDYFILAGHRIPRYDRTSQLVNFYGADKRFPRVNFLDIIDDSSFMTKDELELQTSIDTWDNPDYGLLQSGMFKDKIVLIGSTLPEDKDIFPIGFSRGGKKGDNMIYGVEFHANAIQGILEENFLYNESSAVKALAILLGSIMVFYFSSYIKGRRFKHGLLPELIILLFIALMIVSVRLISTYCFNHLNYVVTISGPVLAIALGYFASTAYHYAKEKKQKSMIKSMFSHYLSSNIVDELLHNPDKLKLGGEKRELTVFFSDIKNFSTFSESKRPEELVSIINEYLSEMTSIVLRNSGTLDKYVGDAVMAFWGAPLPLENHAYLACATAVAMQQRLDELREYWRSEKDTDIYVRIGINTGDMIVGNIGGKDRFDYTVMGDNVNLASRLEGANKMYNTSIMISEATNDQVCDLFLTRELDIIVVKGKSKPIRVYELMGHTGKADSRQRFIRDNFHKALGLYRSFLFTEAKAAFIQLRDEYDDAPSAIYADRCSYYEENAPEKDWDFTFVMKEK